MDTKVIQTTCSYCSVGCNLDITVPDEGPVTLKPTKNYPVNEGFCCPKGFHLLTPFQSEERGTIPLLKKPDGTREEVSWTEAAAVFAQRFKAIMAQHGPESVAFISTGQIPMEEMALLGTLTKMGMGWVHGDGNTRQCMATAAVAYKQSFGFDAPPFSYKDLEESDLMVFIGSNPVINHPILWGRVKKNPHQPVIVVVDPRTTETAQEAALHLPLQPKSDLPLLYGLTRILIEEGWVDHDYIEKHTEGFEELARRVLSLPLEECVKATGISLQVLKDLARRIHEARAASFWWTMGVNQGHEAVRTAQAIINLALITGHIGRPGTGANSLTGQANAMGSRLYSNTTNLIGGYNFLDEKHRRHVAEVLDMPYERIPSQGSLPYHRIIEEIQKGTIKGLWIIATNPGHSWIHKTDFHKAMKGLDFLVVQELYPNTETSNLAHLYLPAAGSVEKTGTFINSERRIGLVSKAVNPPGQAKSDFEIFWAVAEAWGCADLFKNWKSPEAAFLMIQRLSRGQPCDISGIGGYAQIREKGGIQWPYPLGRDSQHEGTNRRLFADGKFFTPSKKAQLIVDELREPLEKPDQEFPFVLLTGRGSVMQFHTQTRTGKVPFLNKKSRPEGYVEIHPDDAQALGLEPEGSVWVLSRRGEVEVKAVVSPSMQKGQVFMPMHYPETNWLTFPSFDPHSFEPSYKYGAVRLEKRTP